MTEEKQARLKECAERLMAASIKLRERERFQHNTAMAWLKNAGVSGIHESTRDDLAHIAGVIASADAPIPDEVFEFAQALLLVGDVFCVWDSEMPGNGVL